MQESSAVRIRTPEQVDLNYVLAGIGSRSIAQLIDLLILLGFYLILGASLLLGHGLHWLGSAKSYAIGTAIVVAFFVFWGYFIALEYAMSGRTVGKRMCRIRVVRADGRPLGFYTIVVRNLLRAIDFLPSGYLLGVISALLTTKEQRIGDVAAGTWVVIDEPMLQLAPLAVEVPTGDASLPPDVRGIEERTVTRSDIPVQLVLPSTLSASWQQTLQTFAKRSGGMPAALRADLAQRIWNGLLQEPGVRVEAIAGYLDATLQKQAQEIIAVDGVLTANATKQRMHLLQTAAKTLPRRHTR